MATEYNCRPFLWLCIRTAKPSDMEYHMLATWKQFLTSNEVGKVGVARVHVGYMTSGKQVTHFEVFVKKDGEWVFLGYHDAMSAITRKQALKLAEEWAK